MNLELEIKVITLKKSYLSRTYFREFRQCGRKTMLNAEVIGEQTIADAILDRIVHDPHRVEMNGESMRKKKVINEEIEIKN
jgi:hypothetical protein